MKKLLFTLAACLLAFNLFAQKTAYTQGSSDLQLGIGLGATYYASSGGFSRTSSVPPVFASYEYGFTDRLSGGGIVGYASNKYNFGTGDVKYTYLQIAARGNYHFFFFDSKKLDPYAGLTLGYNSIKATISNVGAVYSPKGSSVLFGAQLGTRYYFTPHIGAFAELGFGLAILGVGVVFKF